MDLNNINNLDDFMMIDKLRLLEIFLENEKLLTWMYERIFPDRMSTLRDNLNKNSPNNFHNVNNKHNSIGSNKDIVSTERD